MDRKESIMERRDFVNKTCKCLLVCAAPVSLLTLSGCEDNNEEPYNNSSGGSLNTDFKEIFDLDSNPYTALKTVGNSIVTSGNKVDSSGLILFRKSESEIVCFSRTCTHNGGTISNFINGISTCPNHSSKFDTSGNPVSGPAGSALSTYRTALEGTILTVYKN